MTALHPDVREKLEYLPDSIVATALDDLSGLLAVHGAAMLREAARRLRASADAPAPVPVAFGNLAPEFQDKDRVLFTDPREAEKYNRQCYKLTPLYAHPPAAGVTKEMIKRLRARGVLAPITDEWHEKYQIEELEAALGGRE